MDFVVLEARNDTQYDKTAREEYWTMVTNLDFSQNTLPVFKDIFLLDKVIGN